jgi:hypothetical protein
MAEQKFDVRTKVVVMLIKEDKRNPFYLVSKNIPLAAIEGVKFYVKRWKIEQIIKDLKQRLGFGD